MRKNSETKLLLSVYISFLLLFSSFFLMITSSDTARKNSHMEFWKRHTLVDMLRGYVAAKDFLAWKFCSRGKGYVAQTTCYMTFTKLAWIRRLLKREKMTPVLIVTSWLLRLQLSPLKEKKWISIFLKCTSFAYCPCKSSPMLTHKRACPCYNNHFFLRSPVCVLFLQDGFYAYTRKGLSPFTIRQHVLSVCLALHFPSLS